MGVKWPTRLSMAVAGRILLLSLFIVAAYWLLEGPAHLNPLLLLPFVVLLSIQAMAQLGLARYRLASSEAAPPRTSIPSPESFDWPLHARESFLRRRSRFSLVLFTSCIGAIFLGIGLVGFSLESSQAETGIRLAGIAAAFFVPFFCWLVFRPAPPLELTPSGFRVGKDSLPFADRTSLSFAPYSWTTMIRTPGSPILVVVASGGRSVFFFPGAYVSPPTVFSRPSEEGGSPVDSDLGSLETRTLIQGLLSLSHDGNARAWLDRRFPMPEPGERPGRELGQDSKSVRLLHPVTAVFLAALVLTVVFTLAMAVLRAA